MLSIGRKYGESVFVGDIEVTVFRGAGQRVQLQFVCGDVEVPIRRRELGPPQWRTINGIEAMALLDAGDLDGLRRVLNGE